MPLKYYRSHAGSEVALWEAEEPLSFFAEALHEQEFPTAPGSEIKHPEKVLQWYASRYLLCEVYPEAIQLYADRKPYLFNGPEISFSHSKRTVAVMISNKTTGIDIQWNDSKLKIISSRFTDLSEVKKVQAKSEIHALSLIWAVKEAVFKKYGTGLAFKDIHLLKHDPIADECSVAIKRMGESITHRLATPFLDDLALAYLIE